MSVRINGIEFPDDEITLRLVDDALVLALNDRGIGRYVAHLLDNQEEKLASALLTQLKLADPAVISDAINTVRGTAR